MPHRRRARRSTRSTRSPAGVRALSGQTERASSSGRPAAGGARPAERGRRSTSCSARADARRRALDGADDHAAPPAPWRPTTAVRTAPAASVAALAAMGRDTTRRHGARPPALDEGRGDRATRGAVRSARSHRARRAGTRPTAAEAAFHEACVVATSADLPLWRVPPCRSSVPSTCSSRWPSIGWTRHGARRRRDRRAGLTAVVDLQLAACTTSGATSTQRCAAAALRGRRRAVGSVDAADEPDAAGDGARPPRSRRRHACRRRRGTGDR